MRDILHFCSLKGTMAVLVLAFASHAQSAGQLDPSFGDAGRVHPPIGTHAGSSARDLAIQPDQKIVLVGTESGLLLSRYLPDGQPDPTFGVNGKVSTHLDDPSIWISAGFKVALQPDGKIVATGLTYGTGGEGSDWYLVRYLSNGDLDPTFGTGGILRLDHVSQPGYWNDVIAVQADGRVIVSRSDTTDFHLIRLNSDGSPDTTFGLDGRVTVSFDFPASVQGLVLQSDGKIVALGGGVTLARLNSDGSLDNSFGDHGKVVTRLNDFPSARAIAIQPDNKLIVAGELGQRSLLIRYEPDGTLDREFGASGVVILEQRIRLNSVVIQRNGKILVGGNSGGFYYAPFPIMRLLSDGHLDTSFGTGGVVTTQFPDMFPPDGKTCGAGYGGVRAVGLQANGKIIAAGSWEGPVLYGDGGSCWSYAAVSRHIGDAVARKARFDFDGDGRTDAGIFRPSWGEWWLLRSGAGPISYEFGAIDDLMAPADYTGDGKTDVAMWRPSTGEWVVLRSEDSTYYLFPFGANGDIPTPGDFDGDDRADPAVFRPSTGYWYISRSSDGSVTQTQWGSPDDLPVTADYEGDGRDDIAIFRPATGEWWLLRSSGGSTTLQFGLGTDRIAPGDYTGDGKADCAVWRPSTGEWFVLRSEDSSYFSFPFGTTGDLPAPGDYDGDGNFDAAVFRSSTGTWFLRQSTNGINIFQWGLSIDIPISGAFVR